MSQVQQSRSTRATVKRTLSVDNLDVTTQLQSLSTENLLKDKSGRNLIIVNSKQRCKQKQAQTQDSQPSHSESKTATSDITGDVMEDNSGVEIDTDSYRTMSQGIPNITADDYLNEIHALKSLVSSLQTQLNFVLSFLGITDVDHSNANTLGRTLQAAVHAVNQEVVSDSTSEEPPQNNSSGLTDRNSQSSRSAVSYAEVARKPTALSTPLRQAVVSAVYADFEEKDRRARNVVISGLSHVFYFRQSVS